MAYLKLTPNLKEELENQMREVAKRNGLIDEESPEEKRQQGKFVSNAFVAELLGEKNLAAHLRKGYDGYFPSWFGQLPSDLQELSKKIRTEGPILYCILILLDREGSMGDLLENNLNDKTLFDRDDEKPGIICPIDKLRSIPQLAQFADEFYQKQWHFPPRLYQKDQYKSDDFKPLKFELQSFKFPFTGMDVPLGSGGFGQVYATKISTEYVDYNKTSEKELEIACKEISLEHKTEEGRRRVFREVAVLLNKRHYNLTEVLGCFEAGIKRPHPAGGPSPYLYILQPRAVTDMKNWLKGQQFDILGGESEEQHIYRAAILGLTSGLSYLHSEMGGNVVYHRDLKPENILLFKESRLVWKIADFGCANLKPVEKTATKSTRTTKFWAPPEYFFDKDSPKSSTKHARAHDVYSMGCVFLVLVTLIVYGRQTGGFPAPAGILAYDNLIEGVTDDSSDSTTGPPAVFLNSENDTLEWIAKLKDRRKGDPTYGTLANVLKIIEEMLLPYESRMWSWEAEFYLYEATNEWEKESAENGSHFGDHFGHGEDSKKSMSLNKLRVVIQAARETDYSIVFGPAQRAIKWHRTELLGVMKSKNWYQSPPQTSKQLKHRPDVIKNAISTLPPRDRFKNPMFGYQSIGDDIAWKFHDCNVVALCGLSGIGKTRLAFEYVSQFIKPKSKQKKHVFWVNMTNSDTLCESYRHIVREMRKTEGYEQNAENNNTLGTTSATAKPDSLVPYIEKWLQDTLNGQWIIILDNLSDNSTSKRGYGGHVDHLNIRTMQYHGQFLITTRHRAPSVKMIEKVKNHGFVELPLPSLDDRLRIYDHLTTNMSVHVDKTNARLLLERLAFPKLIDKAVNYMQRNNASPKELLEVIEKRGLEAINKRGIEVDGNVKSGAGFLEGLLQDYLPEALPLDETKWTEEIRQMFTLAMFGQEGAKLELLREGATPDEEQKLSDALVTLRNSYLVQKDDERYFVEKPIEAAIWSWIEKHEKNAGLLRRYNKTLSMMYKFYEKSFRDGTERTAVMKAWVPQCEGFLRLVKNFKSDPNPSDKFELSTPAVQAIIELSRILHDLGRYVDAAEMLDFAQSRYQTNEHSKDGPVDKDSSTRLCTQYWLDRQIINTYFSYAVNEAYSAQTEYWVGAKNLIDDRITRAGSWEANYFQVQFYRWNLDLELVRVLSHLKDWEIAESLLSSMSKLNIAIRQLDGKLKPELADIDEPNSDSSKHDKPSLDRRTDRQNEFRNIAIHKMWAEGLLHLERGNYEQKSGNESEAVQYWELAEEALRIAERATKFWTSDRGMRDELLINLAETQTRLGTHEGLKNARETFDKALKDIERIHGSDCKRAWDMEYRINFVRLATDRDLDVAICSLTSLYTKYSNRFGETVTVTMRCKKQLKKAKAKRDVQNQRKVNWYSSRVLYGVVVVAGIPMVCGLILGRNKWRMFAKGWVGGFRFL